MFKNLVAGPFELLTLCYVCGEEAVQDSNGGPICRKCYVQRVIADYFWEMYQYKSAGWLPKNWYDNARNGIIQWEAEMVKLNPSYVSQLNRFDVDFPVSLKLTERDS